MWEKGEMLFPSMFSFSYDVFNNFLSISVIKRQDWVAAGKINLPIGKKILPCEILSISSQDISSPQFLDRSLSKA